jgi:hypothetical protein
VGQYPAIVIQHDKARGFALVFVANQERRAAMLVENPAALDQARSARLRTEALSTAERFPAVGAE